MFGSPRLRGPSAKSLTISMQLIGNSSTALPRIGARIRPKCPLQRCYLHGPSGWKVHHHPSSFSRRHESMTTAAGASASAASRASSVASRLAQRIRGVFYGASALVIITFGYFYVTDTRAGVHRWLAVPALRWIYDDAEDAHKAGTKILKVLYDLGLYPRERDSANVNDGLGVEFIPNGCLPSQSKRSPCPGPVAKVFGTRLLNPLGISAGLDKNAYIPSALLALGPGVVEIGAVTPQPQAGNARPRVFRLASQRALVNRYGFNSDGAAAVAARLHERVRRFAYADAGLGLDAAAERAALAALAEHGVPQGSLRAGQLLAVQIGKNKTTPEHDVAAVTRDYVQCVERLGRYADVLVVNVSSPNTPGLRALQAAAPLTELLAAVVRQARAVPRGGDGGGGGEDGGGSGGGYVRRRPPAVMVKVSPDEDSPAQIAGVCRAVWDAGVDGVIVANTTTTRPVRAEALPPGEAAALREPGGFSGPQTFDKTLALVRRYRKELDADPRLLSPSSSSSSTPSAESSPPAQKVIFASGGITNGQQALQVLNAGASVAMVYTALVYSGVGTITRIKQEMKQEIFKP